MLLNCFFDVGSTCFLILTAFAEKYGLTGIPVNVTLYTINGKKARDTKLYCIKLLDMKGDIDFVRAFGVENISEEIPQIELEEAKYGFSNKLQAYWHDVKQRPMGKIELLVGA